eukprot:3093854-Amphidinium_carterae.1
MTRSLDQGAPNVSQEALQKNVTVYHSLLRRLEKQAEDLKGVQVPLAAVQHIAESGESLGPWCNSVVEKLEGLQGESRARFTELAQLATTLEASSSIAERGEDPCED